MLANIKNFFKARYNEEQFHPGLLALFVNPFYFARKGLQTEIEQGAKLFDGSMLDVGCGSKPYFRYFKTTTYIGLDIDNEVNRRAGIAEYLFDGTQFPFDADCFDGVISNQVLEHVFDPNQFFAEINRVLKLKGLLMITVPFVWDEHEQPFDYARYTSFGLVHLAKKYGFEVVYHKKMGTGFEIICQLTNLYLFKIFARLPIKPIVRVLLGSFVFAVFNIMGVLLAKVLPDNEDLYLDQLVIFEKTDDL
jgi:SAM-dependent methyltransferase